MVILLNDFNDGNNNSTSSCLQGIFHALGSSFLLYVALTLELFQVQLPVDGDVLFGGEPAAHAATVAVRVHAGGGRGGHGERLGAADGGRDRGRPGGAPQD